MAEAKNQHYIPQSYLRNFAVKNKSGEQIVYVRFAGEKFHFVNFKNICSETYFYAIPMVGDSKKNIVENYYSATIDSYFPEITGFLEDKNNTNISADLRFKIVACVCNLYFRTPKFLSEIKSHMEKLISLSYDYHLGKTERHIVLFIGKKIDIKNVNPDELIKRSKEVEQLLFLKEHLEIFNDLINFRIKSGIGITYIEDDSKFITCDNPVFSDSSKGFESSFDPNVIFQFPITPKILITLLPISDDYLKDSFQKIKFTKFNTLITNYMIEENSEKWIIGSEETLSTHVLEQEICNDPTSEDSKQLVDVTEGKGLLMLELEAVMAKHNYSLAPEVIDKFVVLSKSEEIKNDPNFIETLKILKDRGLIK